jgi:hypothetical protein
MRQVQRTSLLDSSLKQHCWQQQHRLARVLL